jgi:hypothetical protein
MKSMCCLCIQFNHENTSERTILHLVKKKDPLSKVWLLALQKRLATPLNIIDICVCVHLKITSSVCACVLYVNGNKIHVLVEMPTFV